MKADLGVLTILVGITATGCGASPQTHVQTGAGVGGSVGSVIGARASATTRGAIVAAVIGGEAGAIIGRRMDNVGARLRSDLPQEHVERVGEGIIVTFSVKDLFDSAANEPRPNAATLRALAARLAQTDEIELLVIADPDAAGVSGDRELAARRAAAIKNELVRHGLAAARILVGQRPAHERSEQTVQIALYANKRYRDAVISESGRRPQ